MFVCTRGMSHQMSALRHQLEYIQQALQEAERDKAQQDQVAGKSVSDH